MRKCVIASLTVSIMLGSVSLPLAAQISDSSPKPTNLTDVYFINRAKNLARQAAITANGGLERYRPDPVMFGPAVQTAYVRNDNGSITFTFTGGIPGYTAPTIETVATVTSDGAVKLDYNGAVRSGVGSSTLPSIYPPAPVITPLPPTNLPAVLPSLPPPAPVIINPTIPSGSNEHPAIAWIDQDAFFARARNLARQAAIKANGGLDRYRPEPSMFGPSAQSPATTNSDGSVTFTFKGGTPGSTLMTTQSVVTVTVTGTVNLQYNGPIR